MSLSISKPSILYFFIITSFLAAPGGAYADSAALSRPDDHAPIGVMGEHAHKQGEWMLSYRAMHMEMDGNRDGTSRQSTADVLSNFVVAPTEMQMDMHMFGAMYAPNDKVTLMLMVPYVELEMDHINRMGAKFTTRSSGLGDVKISSITTLWADNNRKLLLNFGVSLPTGSNTEEGLTPVGKVRLPYPMQLGSGTYDLMPGLTYLIKHGNYSYGFQGIATLRTGNDEGYRLGNRFDGSMWAARLVNDAISVSARISGEVWGRIRGEDSRVSQILSPMGMGPFPSVHTAQPDLRGGNRVNLALGANYYFHSGFLKDHRLAVEVSAPIHQNLDGPQLETDWTATVGWQKAY